MDKPTTEYAALDFDGTERRANYRTVAYRIDILHICERKDAAAILYEIIYRWQTEVRKPEVLKEIERRKKANLTPLTEEEVENMMWVWMSYNDFVRESGEAVAYNTVIRTLDYLVETAQILECRENHDPRYPDYEYRIRMDMVKKKLKALPAAPAFLPKVPKKKSKTGEESTQVGTVEKRSTQKGRRAQRSTQVGTESTQNGRATTQVGREVYPNGGTSHTTTHTTHIEHTEEDTGDSAGEQNSTPQPVAHATSPAPDTQNEPISFVEAREYLTALGYKLEPTPQAYNCEEPGKALWSVSEPNAHHLFDTLTTTKIKQLAARLKERAHQPEKPASEKSEQDSVATPELSTLTGTSPQPSAKVEPKQPYQPPTRTRNGNRTTKGNTSNKVFFSVEGQAFRAMYEQLAGFELDETPANAVACNKLGKKPGMTEDNLKDALQRIQKDNWLSERNIVITVQRLADDTYTYRWEYWYQLIKQAQRAATAKKHVPTREEDPYSVAALIAEQNPTYFAERS